MILREDPKPKREIPFRRFWPLGVLVLLLGLAYWGYKWVKRPLNRPENSIFCGMEDTTTLGGRLHFREGDQVFTHGETRNTSFAHSGKYSSRAYKDMEYGVTYETLFLRPGERVEASAWIKAEGGMAKLMAGTSWGVTTEGVVVEGPDAQGWAQYHLSFYVPTDQTEGSFSIYFWNPDTQSAWMDDLIITRTEMPKQNEVEAGTFPTLDLIISDHGMEKLRNKREEALRLGVLQTGEEDWVKAKIEDGRFSMKAKVRLKGDWTDHLNGDKWSYRVEMEEGFAWNRMTVFSLQSPEARSFLSEWLIHELYRRNGVLSPRYDFILLKINGVPKGIYAYEEHFEKTLVESQSRREGPILKFNEDDWWVLVERQMNHGMVPLERLMAPVPAAPIEAFGQNKVLKDSLLKTEFLIGQNLLFAYKYQQKPAHEVFDLKKLALYLAVSDLGKAYHGLIWHNLRFYYNPVISKLEPIGFDAYTETGPLDWVLRPFVGQMRNPKYKLGDLRESFVEGLFTDSTFYREYIHALNLVTSTRFLLRQYVDLVPEIARREVFLRQEYLGYSLNLSFLTENAAQIRHAMLPLPQNGLQAYDGGAAADGRTLQLCNFNVLPVVPIGVSDEPDRPVRFFGNPSTIGAYSDSYPPDVTSLLLKGREPGKWLFYRIPGMDSLFSTPIKPFPHPSLIIPSIDLFAQADPALNPLLVVVGKEIHIPPGKHTLNQDLLVPEGYTLYCGPGTELVVNRGIRILSKSPVHFIGTEENPIRIVSTDGTAKGFSVIQAPEKSFLRHVVFDGLNTFNYQGWGLSGAVNFYESEVDLDYCSFVNNHCEDALNIIRSVFKLTHSYFGFTFGDGFDSDFCHGFIGNCHFYHTGNDGMDLSGSTITVDNCLVEHPGDKGMSCGEQATITVYKLEVKESGIGVASKDLSKVSIGELHLTNVKQGVALYQKKPEYGPATMEVRYMKQEAVEIPYVVQSGSVLTLEGKTIQGTK